MAIKQTITNEYHFNDWLIDARKRDSSYGNCFTPEGAKAVQDYYENLSDDLGEDIEFDPIAWCCEWSEYDSITEAMNGYKQNGDDELTEGEMLVWFQDNTQVIELDNGHIIVGEF